MGRRCHCDTLFRRLEEDVRLRTLPMAAQMLWLRLMRLAAGTSGFDGVLRFGSEFGFLVAVSLAVSCAETDVEPALAALERRGLVERDGADALRLPDAEPAAARSEAARINGLRGGRPRRGETPEAARERRQGSLMLPMAGRAETQETKAEPNGESSRVAAKPIAIEAQQAADAREETDWLALGPELADIAGLDPARGAWTFKPVKGWLEAGASADLIRDVVRRKVATRTGDAGPIRSLLWFDQAVREAAQRAAPPPPPAPRSTTGYEAAFRQWKESGAHGAPPSLAEWRASQAVA